MLTVDSAGYDLNQFPNSNLQGVLIGENGEVGGKILEYVLLCVILSYYINLVKLIILNLEACYIRDIKFSITLILPVNA